MVIKCWRTTLLRCTLFLVCLQTSLYGELKTVAAFQSTTCFEGTNRRTSTSATNPATNDCSRLVLLLNDGALRLLANRMTGAAGCSTSPAPCPSTSPACSGSSASELDHQAGEKSAGQQQQQQQQQGCFLLKQSCDRCQLR